jgi:hypothetical protein
MQSKKEPTTPHYTYTLVGKSKLEASFGSINAKDTATRFTIETKELILDDTLRIHRIVQSSNGARISRRGKNILDVIQGCIDKELRVGTSRGTDIPCTRLDADVVANAAKLFELAISNHHSILAQNGNLGSIWRPNNILNLGSSDFSQHTTTLDFKENGTIFGTKQNTASRTSFQEGIDVGNGGLYAFRRFIVEILDNNLTLITIQHCKPVLSQEDSRTKTGTALSVRDGTTGIAQGEGNEFVATTVDIGADKDVAL